MSVARQNIRRSAGATDVVVIGAGHAGLAASCLLNELSVDHVVLERGDVANSWRSERWDSLKLLTPNWQTRLPGFRYQGDDPDGYMSMPELIEFMQDYADATAAPVRTNTTVTSVRFNDGGGYEVATDQGNWYAKCIVIASGACNTASIPRVSADVPAGIEQLTPHTYQNPSQLRRGGVLVVGASASGLQLADEIHKAGHDVTVAAGEHVRMPRRYRGQDILYWMSRTGLLDERYDQVDDVVRARRLPSSQLVGSHDYEILDLNRLAADGVRIVGRMMGVNEGVAQFSGSLRNVCALADLKMNRLLDGIDTWIDQQAIDCESAKRFDNTHVADAPALTLPLNDGSIRTIVWATGFRPDYSWLDVPVLDRKGMLKHDGGIVEAPGLYALGLPMMRRRKSSFIFGIEDDARDITRHLHAYLSAVRLRKRCA